jgi:hypothetical protein
LKDVLTYIALQSKLGSTDVFFFPLHTREISIKPSTFVNSQWSTDTWKKEIIFTTYRIPMGRAEVKDNH